MVFFSDRQETERPIRSCPLLADQDGTAHINGARLNRCLGSDKQPLPCATWYTLCSYSQCLDKPVAPSAETLSKLSLTQTSASPSRSEVMSAIKSFHTMLHPVARQTDYANKSDDIRLLLSGMFVTELQQSVLIHSMSQSIPKGHRQVVVEVDVSNAFSTVRRAHAQGCSRTVEIKL